MAIVFESQKVESHNPRKTTNFILYEKSSPNGSTRVAVKASGNDMTKFHGLQIGDFVKVDGTKAVIADVTAPTSAEMKLVAGISLSGVSSNNMFNGLLSDQGEPYVVYLKGTDAQCKITIKDTLFSEYLDIPLRDKTTHIYSIPTEIVKWCDANGIEIAQCGY
ncbi:hypothetical protein ACEU59_07560 [Buttiauxella noackiae]|uniref:hypothetical protein n=1 Tax=Buttiauxella noackiae TaxID=82992 RepID=UPI0035A676E3